MKKLSTSLHPHLGLLPGFTGQPHPSSHCQHLHLSPHWMNLKLGSHPPLPDFWAGQWFWLAWTFTILVCSICCRLWPRAQNCSFPLAFFCSALHSGQGLVELSLQSPTQLWGIRGREWGIAETWLSFELIWGTVCRQKRDLDGWFQLPTEMSKVIWRSIHLRYPPWAAESHLRRVCALHNSSALFPNPVWTSHICSDTSDSTGRHGWG